MSTKPVCRRSRLAVDRFGDVSAAMVGSHLGAKHDFVAAIASLEPAPDDHLGGVGFAADFADVVGAQVVAPVLLGLGSAVGFGGVEQRDTVFDGVVHDLEASVFVDLAAEGRAAEADAADGESGAAEVALFHCRSFKTTLAPLTATPYRYCEVSTE